MTVPTPEQVAEIRERHEEHVAMRKAVAGKEPPPGWAYKSQAMNAECLADRAALLALIDHLTGNLHTRDDFIVGRGLWPEFTDSLAASPTDLGTPADANHE